MAFFMTNVCKFKECALSFPSLGQLIEHIEDNHIDLPTLKAKALRLEPIVKETALALSSMTPQQLFYNDPQFLEQQESQQPSALALSYVIKFVTDAAKHQPKDSKKKVKSPKSPGGRSVTPTGSEFDDDHMHSDSDSEEGSIIKLNDPYSSELLLHNVGNPLTINAKPFMCPVPGCKKRYKNINGMKYHARNGHKKDKGKLEQKVKKIYKCGCGKSYRSSQGLRQHMIAQHPAAASTKSAGLTTSGSSTITSTILSGTIGTMGLSLANGSIVLEPCPPISNGNVVETATSVTPGSNATRITPSSGFTFVTLPSGSLDVGSLLSNSRQPTQAACGTTGDIGRTVQLSGKQVTKVAIVPSKDIPSLLQGQGKVKVKQEPGVNVQ